MSPRVPIYLLVASSSVFAQNFLDPLVVTASRLEQEASRAPYSSAVIGSEFIWENTRRTLPEALAYTPGVLVQKTAHGHGSPFIRGFTGRQNLLLLDGVRLNNSTFRSGPIQYWNTVDPLSIDHLELIKSQGSVLYGSDAVGGTVNSFSKSSDFRERAAGQVFYGGGGSYEYRTNGQGSHIGRIESQTGVGEKFGVWLGLSAKDYGDIEDSDVGEMVGTGYPEEDLDFRFDWAVTPESTVTLAYNYVNQDAISRWHRTLNNPGWTTGGNVAAPGLWTSNNYDQERSMTYLRYAGKNPQAGAAIQGWNATLSYQDSTDSESQNRSPAENSVRRSNIDVNTIGVDVSLESAMGPGTLVYGMDYYHDEVDSSGFRNNLAGTKYQESLPVADDSDYDLLGIYSQYLWKPVDKVEITGGARYTYAEASLGRFYDLKGVEQSSESQEWNSFVGSVRGLYQFNAAWSVYGGLSQAFRAPNLDDLTGNQTAKSGSTSLGSTSVDPEEFLTYEIGTRQATETTSMELSFFYTDAQDLISAVPVAAKSKDTINTNATEGYVYGIELQGAWEFHPQWTLSGFGAWQDGRNEIPLYLNGPVVEKSPTRLLPLTGSLALRWDHPSGKFWVEGRILGATDEDRIAPEDQAADSQRIPTGGTPGYLTASIRAGWNVNEHLNLLCGVENLTDESYRIHGSGQNEPGLNGILGLRLNW
ncbi:MAG: TonB-dependent receptor plug domain-containing protein [Luteolibacter sp.]